MRHPPGSVRDSIVEHLLASDVASLDEIHKAVVMRIGDVAQSSIRSYLNLNTPQVFERLARGQYRLRSQQPFVDQSFDDQTFEVGRARLVKADAFEWLRSHEPRKIHAVVTDPPYGLVEYTDVQQEKLRNGKGGVWRVPPSFDGHKRSPLPRFTVLNDGDHAAMHEFFLELGRLLFRVTVPGANVIVASNPLLAHIVADAMSRAGLELRGSITRLVMTMRGGDRPKNAHREFSDVSVMPRSMYEPWVILRHPLEGRTQDNLRKWKTGGFRRISDSKPFGDVIQSGPTSAKERRIAPHPSLKPQSFLRRVVRASLPLGEGLVLDPFAGSGSTLAAANAIGYESVGVERDTSYFELAKNAMTQLAALSVE
jgi:site-specific DNA-methyltransferase (adenine-specific)